MSKSVVHYTLDGKIDIFKVLQDVMKKFQGLRKHVYFENNPQNFEFNQTAKEMIEDVNRVWLKRQRSNDMDHVFEGKSKSDWQKQKDLTRFLVGFSHTDKERAQALKREESAN